MSHAPAKTWPSPTHATVALAPMEGVTDAPMRDLLTRKARYDYCVTEFLRVTQQALPARAFRRHVPELTKSAGRTLAGTPVQVQILGGHAERMAESAQNAVAAGALAIDINFGCPAPTVNRNDGGASLLKHPRRLREIVEAVRRAVPAHVPVSAKLRLGWDCASAIDENADMAAQGGASWITIHGRTKADGYRPPAKWEPIGRIKKRLGTFAVVANGDLWSIENFKRCREITGCEHFMLGRSALANPMLASQIAEELHGAISVAENVSQSEREFWRELFIEFAQISQPFSHTPNYALRRSKQWIAMAQMGGRLEWAAPLKRADSLDEMLAML